MRTSSGLCLVVIALFACGCAAADPPADHNAVRIKLSFDNKCTEVAKQQKEVLTELAKELCQVYVRSLSSVLSLSSEKALANVVFVQNSFEDKSTRFDSQCYGQYDCLATKDSPVKEILGRCLDKFNLFSLNARRNFADELKDSTSALGGGEIEKAKVEAAQSFKVLLSEFKAAMIPKPATASG